MDPVKEFLREKRAAMGGMFRNAGHVPQLFGDALMTGAATAAAGGALAGAGYGAMHLYNAATKGRDFRQMLANNPDLIPEHEKDPKAFNQLFTSLRNINPTFSKDPTIAGTYMRRMVGSPAAGGVLTDALGFRDKEIPGLGDAALTAGQAGIAAKAKGWKSDDSTESRLQNFQLAQKEREYDREKNDPHAARQHAIDEQELGMSERSTASKARHFDMRQAIEEQKARDDYARIYPPELQGKPGPKQEHEPQGQRYLPGMAPAHWPTRGGRRKP